MFVVASLAILGTMALALVRALLGPTVYDRVLAMNMFGTKTVLIIAVLGFLTGRPDFLTWPSLCTDQLHRDSGRIEVLRYGDLGRRWTRREER